MRENKFRLIVGSLLHDVGKIVYRAERLENHSLSGYNFLKNDAGVADEEILEQVKYHHASEIKQNPPKDTSLAYITYIADNIASGADRRKTDGGAGFDRNMPLQSVFNILNGNRENLVYKPQDLGKSINYPTDGPIEFSRELYRKTLEDIKDSLKGIEYTGEYINSVFEMLEADCTFIPSSTNKGEIADISLYDHLKITAAVGSCIMDYLESEGIANYRDELYLGSDKFYDKEAFLMYSFDLSGIQDFIYTISSKGALKMLRSRSFYLEMLCEHIIDEILEELELSRANLIYSGGGHAYILLANTQRTKDVLENKGKGLNEWFMENFKTSLYAAYGYTECSARDFMNAGNDRYSEIFRRISAQLSKKKLNRYKPSDIKNLNYSDRIYGERECRICHRADVEIQGNVCGVCKKLTDMSDDITEKNFFIVKCGDTGLPLPFGKSLISGGGESETISHMQDEDYVRCYSKNKMYTGKNLATKIWVGDYHSDKEFEALARKSEGIERIAVIRGDVDNLGQTFVKGFERERVSLSRTAVLSRKLSIFFKKHINTLLSENGYNALIVYSGGDDIFIVSAWSDAVKIAITIRDAFEKFTQSTLTISMGIGMYRPKYPIAAMAADSGRLEEASKSEGKNRITVFSDKFSDKNGFDVQYTFTWHDMKKYVLGEKYKALDAYFGTQTEHGKNMLYNLLDYLRNIGDSINLARMAYLLTRLEPKDGAPDREKERYDIFARQIYEWAQKTEDRLQLITAVYLYVYNNRESQKEE